MKLTPREPLVIGTAPATDHEGGTVLTNSDARKGQIAMEETTLPAVLATEAEPAPPRTPLAPERSDFLEGDALATAKVEAFLARALEATGSDAPTTAGALVPWICDALLSNHSVKAYGRDLMDFLRHMQATGSHSSRSPPIMSSSTSGPCSRPAGPRRPWPGGSRSCAVPTSS